MFKAIGVVLAGIIVVPVAAQAADLPARTAPPVFVPPAPVFSWTGFYLGVNAGYGFDAKSVDGPSNLSVPAFIGSYPVTPANGAPFLARSGGRKDGFVGGGQVGYNLEIGPGPGAGVVVGVEADFQYSQLNDGHQNGGLAGGLGNAVPGGDARVTPAGLGLGVGTLNQGQATSNGNVAFFNGGRRGPGEFLGTARARVGYAFGTLLLYGTGGFAYSTGRGAGVDGGFANGASVPASFYAGAAERAAGAAVGPTSTGGLSSTQYGYVVGAGVEYALPTDSFINVFHSSAVTLKVEGLYFNLGHSGSASGTQVVGVSNTGAAITATGYNTRDNDFALVRAGLNFKFGAVEAAPVVARY